MPEWTSQEEFVRAVGGVYEESPWVAERLWQSGGAAAGEGGAEALAVAMAGVVAAASAAERDALLQAHPRLAAGGAMSAQSQQEQQGAQLGNLAAGDAAEFAELNRQYEEKFNFPFIMAVAGATRAQIAAALRERLAGDNAAEEKRRAFAEVDKIARLRLQKIWNT